VTRDIHRHEHEVVAPGAISCRRRTSSGPAASRGASIPIASAPRRASISISARWRSDRPVSVAQVVPEDRFSRGLVGREHQHGAIETAGQPQGAVDLPGLVGRGENEDSLVHVLDAVELGEQLVHHSAHRAPAGLRAALPHRVDLVEEEHARRLPTRLLERLVHPAFTHSEHRIEMSVSPIDRNFAPSSPVTARAMKVFPHPGGPYINRPPPCSTSARN
jgi:hypothetical protein